MTKDKSKSAAHERQFKDCDMWKFEKSCVIAIPDCEDVEVTFSTKCKTVPQGEPAVNELIKRFAARSHTYYLELARELLNKRHE